jgi:hypothetical protein
VLKNNVMTIGIGSLLKSRTIVHRAGGVFEEYSRIFHNNDL